LFSIVVAAFTASATRHLLEIAFALAAIGGASLLAAGLIAARRRELLSLAGVLVAAAGVLAVIAIHWGVTPWNH
jgi:hypothetical protein